MALPIAVIAALALTGAALATFRSPVTASASFSSATLAAPTGLSVTQSCIPSSTIAFRSASTANSSGGLTISAPADVQAGDVLVAQIAQRASGSTVTPPAGWTQVLNNSSGASLQSTIFVHVAGSSEPTSYTFSSTSSAKSAGGIVAYSGVDTNNPVNASAGATGASASMTAPSVTTTISTTMLVSFWSARQESFTTPGSMTQRWNYSAGSGANSSMSVGAADEAVAAAGATGTRTASKSGSLDWTAQSIALKPKANTQVSLSWTVTTSTFASGYKLERWAGSTMQTQTTITPASTTSATDSPLTGGTAYTYKLYSYFRNWTSSQTTST